MAFIAILILIPILGFGVYRLFRNLKGINFNTTPGALLGLIIIGRFLAYTAIAIPILSISIYLSGNDASAGSISIPFKLQLNESAYVISGMGTAGFRNVVGNLRLGQPDLVSVATFSVYVIAIVAFIHFITIKAQQVFRSLYDRNPFIEQNPTLLRQIAILCFAIWAITAAYNFFMTAYLQSQLTIGGIELSLVTINFIRPIFLCGLIFVLSEVFRVGYELKQENELTV